MQEATFLKKLSAFFYKRPVTVLLLFFCLSVAARIPNLGRPLSKHHELNAALVLINAEEWNNKSASFYQFVPVNTYHLPGDNIYNEQPYAYMVNLSFGSLWYIMPYAFFKLWHAPPFPLLLQVFNLILHLISVLLIYRIALILFRHQSSATINALLMAILYMFSPGPLWFHGNGYVHEIAVLPFIFGAVLLYLQQLTSNYKTYKTGIICVLIIAGICCDWLMCFVALALFLTSIIKFIRQHEKQQLYLSIAIAISVIAGIATTLIQFGSFMGYHIYFDGLLSRYNLRGVNANAPVSSIFAIPVYYIIGYGVIIPATLIIYTYHTIKNKKIQLAPSLKKFVAIAAVICVGHHIIFRGFTQVHDYAVIKSGIIISLLATIVITYCILTNKWKTIIVTAVIALNLGVYYYINPPGEQAANGHNYSYFKTLGEHIKAIAQPEDYIFIDTPEMSLLLTYYSKRFYRNVHDLNEAQTFFNQLPGKSALYIHTENFEFKNYSRLVKK